MGTQNYENMWQFRARFPSPLTKINTLNYGDLESWRWNQQKLFLKKEALHSEVYSSSILALGKTDRFDGSGIERASD